MSSEPSHIPELNLLVLTDVHYIHHSQHTCSTERRKARLGLELTRRALRWALRQFDPDAIVLLGDLVDNGLAVGAEDDLAELRDELARWDKPLIVVPGNHDGPAERVFRIFGDAPGHRAVKGHQVVAFADHYDSRDFAARGQAGMDLLREVRAAHPSDPLLVFQHNPIHPAIGSSYPYHLTDNDEVMRGYSECRVTLSVSAHYHPGQELHTERGVRYVTAPALSESPFRMLHLRLRGEDVAATEMPLMVAADFPVVDVHLHSPYAFCDDGMDLEQAIARAQLLGLDGMVFAEHAPHLYTEREGYRGGLYQDHPERLREQRDGGADRMARYRRELEPLRSDFVGLALEADFTADGRMTLLDEDRDGWDFVVGAVHRIPGLDPKSAPLAEVKRAFLRATEQVLDSGVAVLAHPFRYFRRSGLDVPKELFGPMARLIGQSGAAAEVNYHTNEPAPEFFALCLEEGSTLALGTDAHTVLEVAEMQPHLQLLRDIGYDPSRHGPLFTGR